VSCACFVTKEDSRSLDETILQLKLKNKLSQTLTIGSKIEGEDGSTIHVQLWHVNLSLVVYKGHKLMQGSRSLFWMVILQLKMKKIMNSQILKPIKLKNVKEMWLLLKGKLFVTLKEGESCLGNFQFTNISNWIHNHKFHLGLRVVSSCQWL
jgi:hypothetical protein